MTVPAHVPPDLVVEFDIYDDSLADDFNHCTAELPPMCYTEANGGHWILSGFDEIESVFRDGQTFANWNASIPVEMSEGRGRFIPLEYDGPEHTAYRQILLPHFSPIRIRQLEGQLRDLVNELIDGFPDNGSCDFMAHFARPFPARMFLALMGWPTDRVKEFGGWVDDFLYGGGGSSDDPRVKETRAAAMKAVYDYFSEFVEERRNNPADDITTALVEARLPSGRTLTEKEILDYIFILLIAGLHTVEGALAFGVMYFSHNPDERDRLIVDPSILPTAVEELLRWEPPAWGSARVATRDVLVWGQQVKAGDKILLPHQTGNRDSRKVPNPETFDMTRKPNPHLTFGAGPHRCLGAHLARMELRVAFEELHRRVPDYAVDSSRPMVTHMAQVRGVVSMHITYTPEPEKVNAASERTDSAMAEVSASTVEYYKSGEWGG